MAKSTTFKGAPKPYGASGHFDESRRHSLQAKGFKTGHLADSVPMPTPKPELNRLEKEEIAKEQERYQGWANHETWAVKLHWDNNEGDQRFFYEQAKDYKKEGRPVYEFADFLKEQAEEIQESVFNGEGSEEAKMMMQDVGSLWRVDWNEIAEAYYEEVEE